VHGQGSWGTTQCNPNHTKMDDTSNVKRKVAAVPGRPENSLKQSVAQREGRMIVGRAEWLARSEEELERTSDKSWKPWWSLKDKNSTC